MTDEDPALVDKWVKDNEPSYPVVILKNKEFEGFLEVGFFPTGAVIAPDGTLTYSGSAGAVSSPLGKALKKAKKGSLWPKVLDKTAKLIDKDQLAAAYGEILRLVEGGKVSEEDRPALDTFRSYLEGLAGTAHERAKAALEEGNVYLAMQAVERYAEADPPFPDTEACAGILRDCKAMPNLKKELKGGKLFAEAQELCDAHEYSEAVATYRSILKKCADTRIADLARGRAQTLIDDGMPGYERSCRMCGKARKACVKHRETVKL